MISSSHRLSCPVYPLLEFPLFVRPFKPDVIIIADLAGRQSAGHKMRFSRELAGKRRLKRSAAETLKNLLGLLKNFKHLQLIRYGRSRRTTSVRFCFLCKRIHGWKILRTIGL